MEFLWVSWKNSSKPFSHCLRQCCLSNQHTWTCVLEWTAEWTHWLPVKFRCKYTIVHLAYCHFNGALPSYLSASLCTPQTSRTHDTLWNLVEKRSFSFITSSVLKFVKSVKTPLWLQSSGQNFLFSKGLSTNLGRPCFLCMYVCIFA